MEVMGLNLVSKVQYLFEYNTHSCIVLTLKFSMKIGTNFFHFFSAQTKGSTWQVLLKTGGCEKKIGFENIQYTGKANHQYEHNSQIKITSTI